MKTKPIITLPWWRRLRFRYCHVATVHREPVTGDVTLRYVPIDSWVEWDDSTEFVCFLTPHPIQRRRRETATGLDFGS